MIPTTIRTTGKGKKKRSAGTMMVDIPNPASVPIADATTVRRAIKSISILLVYKKAEASAVDKKVLEGKELLYTKENNFKKTETIWTQPKLKKEANHLLNFKPPKYNNQTHAYFGICSV
jgi:hypothetical protein